ncbi:hypothetical protein Pmar_PMAR025296, partial [Perkinsus marinus ATCC 50983]
PGDIDHPLISLVLRGQSNLQPSGQRRVLGIRLQLLRKLASANASSLRHLSNHNTRDSRYCAGFVLAYWFLLRIPSELLVLRRGQLSIGKRNEVYIRLHKRKNTKTPVTLVRYCACRETQPSVCPHTHAEHLLLSSRTGNVAASDLLFDGITANSMRQHLRDTLAVVGIENPDVYGLHSFRRGHATDLAEHAASPATILQMGGWRSAAFRAYLDLPEVEARAAAMIVLNESSDEE